MAQRRRKYRQTHYIYGIQTPFNETDQYWLLTAKIAALFFIINIITKYILKNYKLSKTSMNVTAIFYSIPISYYVINLLITNNFKKYDITPRYNILGYTMGYYIQDTIFGIINIITGIKC